MSKWFFHRAGWFILRCGATFVFCWTLQNIIHQESHVVIDLYILIIAVAMAVVLMRLWMPSNKE